MSIRSVLYFIILLGSLNPILDAQVQKLDRDSKIALQQNRAKLQQQLPAERDTIPGISDSLVVNANGIETTIRYFAKDSIITRITNNSTYLYTERRVWIWCNLN